MTGSAELLGFLDARRGHFRLESGHHGELWLDLDALFLRPARLAPFVEDLGRRLVAKVEPDAVCGPLLGGALIAHSIATMLDLDLFVAEPAPHAHRDEGLFTARYEVPHTIRGHLAGRTVAVVDDVINAGSATRATVTDLRAAGATVVAIGALLVCGSRAAEYAQQEDVVLEHVAALSNRIWEPSSCPLCAAREPLEDPGGQGA